MTRLLTSILPTAAAIAVVGGDAAASQARRAGEHSSTSSRALHVTKECPRSQYSGQAGGFCTITSSNLPAISAGSRIFYLEAAGDTGLDSDLVLYAGPGNEALGHVTLSWATQTGEITFAGGTGHFRGFHAHALVTFDDQTNLWHWDGTYRFGPSHGDEEGGD